jgi:hypothetical protein
MIELNDDRLMFTFPDVHEDAKLSIEFQRTLRIPDDDSEYPLPPGLGQFPLCLVDDYKSTVPERWGEHGGVLLPMFQSEAMWIRFNSLDCEYPFAVKVATGKINAVTGDAWSNDLHQKPQDYLVAPDQPWLDGYCVEKGIIRQFVAMPLGSGYSAEEQLTDKAEHGGVQLIVYPMKREAYEKYKKRYESRYNVDACYSIIGDKSIPDMGLAPGGKMRQEIYDDTYGFDVWDKNHSSRCFVHITNSLVWREITGKQPPTTPPTAQEYTNEGLPWFDYYSDKAALQGTFKFDGVKSVIKMGEEKKDNPLPENKSVSVEKIYKIYDKQNKSLVREGNI